jgi:hypothetical protein
VLSAQDLRAASGCLEAFPHRLAKRSDSIGQTIDRACSGCTISYELKSLLVIPMIVPIVPRRERRLGKGTTKGRHWSDATQLRP